MSVHSVATSFVDHEADATALRLLEVCAGRVEIARRIATKRMEQATEAGGCWGADVFYSHVLDSIDRFGS